MNLPEFKRGIKDCLPIIVAAVPFGMLIGALGVQKGFSVLEICLMSLTVFAGAAQFLIVGLWEYPQPVLLAIGATALVNARHLLMGASISGKIKHYSLPKQIAAMFLLADEIWALAEKRVKDASLTLSYYFGTGIFLYLVWNISTFVGANFGALIEDPQKYGFDFAFVAIFIGLIIGFRTGRTSDLVIVGAGAGSAVTHLIAPGFLPIIVGSACGLAMAWLCAKKSGAA